MLGSVIMVGKENYAFYHTWNSVSVSAWVVRDYTLVCWVLEPKYRTFNKYIKLQAYLSTSSSPKKSKNGRNFLQCTRQFTAYILCRNETTSMSFTVIGEFQNILKLTLMKYAPRKYVNWHDYIIFENISSIQPFYVNTLGNLVWTCNFD